jgi:hypothetical protein
MNVRYVGASSAQIMDTPFVFKRYGQLVEMPDELFKSLPPHFPVITDEEFGSLGHPPEELKQYAEPKTHAKAPKEFIERRAAAWAKIAERVEAASKPAPLPALAAAPPQEVSPTPEVTA